MSEEKKVAFITGAAGGLGTAVVTKLLAKGFTVLVNDNNSENVQALLNQFKNKEIHAYCFDAIDEDAWLRTVARWMCCSITQASLKSRRSRRQA